MPTIVNLYRNPLPAWRSAQRRDRARPPEVWPRFLKNITSIIRPLERISDKQLAFALDCPQGIRFRAKRQDLERFWASARQPSKWPATKASWRQSLLSPLSRRRRPSALEIRVDDDGPGLTGASQMATL